MKQIQIFTSCIFVLLMMCFISQSVEAQVFDIDTVVEDTSSLSLEMLNTPDTFEKELWMNWTVRLTVLEWSSEWNTSNSWEHPALSVLVRASTVNFSEYNNVSFSLNLGSEGWVSMSVKFIHYLHVFTTYDLGNLSHVTSQDYNVSVKFASDMPTTSYTVEMSIYDPAATTTTETTTTSSTTTETTTTEETQTTDLLDYALPLAVGSIVVIVIAVLVKFKK